MNNDIKTYENIRKIATGQGDDYPTGCLLDYPYFKENFKIIAIDLNKQQALDIDSRTIQQINFAANNIFIIEGETVLDFSQGKVTVKVL